jgi:acyl-ACP thioesterase
VTDPGASILVPPPPSGRVFRGFRRVRTADASPRGRLRLDALTGYLQDVSGDDTTDAALDDDVAWVVRRMLLEVREPLVFREDLELVTWCSGVGRSWAERRVSVTGDRGGRAEAAVLWVRIDARSGQPLRLSAQFHERYGEAAGGRRVRARLSLPAAPPAAVDCSPWPLRFVDFDVLGHVNNAAYLVPIEEALSATPELRGPRRVEVEYRQAIEQGDAVDLCVEQRDAGLDAWLTGRAGTYATVRVALL